MANPASVVPDPRVFPALESAPPALRALYVTAEASLAAESQQQADACDGELRAAFAKLLHGDGATLAAAVFGAPSVAVTRHLWRVLDSLWAAPAEGDQLALTVFALPLIIVSGLEGEGGQATLECVLRDPASLAAILRDGGALAGNQTVALAGALVAAEAIDIARLPQIVAWRRLPDALAQGVMLPAPALTPAPIAVAAGPEAVNLRFAVGTAIAKSGADLLADAGVGRWGIPLAQALAREIAAGAASVLVLPRAPQRLLPAVAAGRAAQRDVSAQLFASNAIRRFRGTVGEPSAVISAHRVADAPGAGELRLSLSSPFDARAAEGFRCPLYPLERVGDVATMLIDLLRDCRIADIRTLSGVYADRVPGLGSTLLFKPDTIPDPAQVSVH